MSIVNNEYIIHLHRTVSYLNIFISTPRQEVTFIDILGRVMAVRLIRIEPIIRQGEGRMLELVELVELVDFDECCRLLAGLAQPVSPH